MGGLSVRALLATLVVVAAPQLGGCANQSEPAGPAPTTSTVSDAEGAYRQLHDAKNVSDCGASLTALSDANVKRDVSALRDTAAKYRGLVAAWGELLGKIAFPSSAKTVVDSLRANNASEVRHLDSIAAVTESSLGNVLATYVFFDDAAVTTDVDRLAEVLGHRPSQPLIAADQLNFGRQTYQRDNALTEMLFTAALAHADLNAAKAANRVEEDALQRYADALNTIGWPAGYDGQVSDLRDKIHALIDADRRQVDVSNPSQIVSAPPGGSAETAAESQAQGNLLDALFKSNNGDTLPKC
ncbi:MAG: hypothetical protein QOH60_5204 [Mycobacterium sp.]|jgi:hypothetical protein|nr:hypothetical protein [Mycobacterium sp.]